MTKITHAKKLTIDPLIPLVFAFLSGSLPLLFPIGQQLEYESTLITSWSFLILITLWPWKYFPSTLSILFSLPFLFLSPLVAFNTQTCGCSDGHFITWSFINTLPAWCLAYGFSSLLYKRKIWERLSYLIFVVLSIFITLWVFPQKRMVSLFAGYLHGPIYDEWVGGSITLILIRWSHACLGLALFLWYKKHKKSSFSLAFIWASGVLFQASQTEFNHGHTSLQKALPIHHVTKRWTLYTSDQGELEHTVKAIEFHIKELQSWFPDHDHIYIYQYPSSEIKKRWFGGHYTDVADIVTPSLHITSLQTLRHELVHAMSSKKAFHGLGFHPNIAITEGLAVALAPTPSALPLHDAAAYLLHSGKIKHPKELFSPYFWSHNGHQAYTVAGSFLLFLAKETSQHHVLMLYEGQSLENLTGQTIDYWVDRWKIFLKTVDIKAAELLAQKIFREPSLWKQRCPHSLADLHQYKNSSGYFRRMVLPIRYSPEQHSFWKENLRGPLPKKRKLLKNLRHLPKDLEKSLHDIQKTKSNPPQVLEDIRLALLESDLYALLNQKHKSKKLLNDLTHQTHAWNIGGWKRHILARQELEKPSWRRYLAGWGEIPKHQSTKWIHHWLRLRAKRTWPTKEVRQQSPHPGFEYAWFQTLSTRAKQKKYWDKALLYLKESLPYAPVGHIDSLQQEVRFLESILKSSSTPPL